MSSAQQIETVALLRFWAVSSLCIGLHSLKLATHVRPDNGLCHQGGWKSQAWPSLYIQWLQAHL